MRVFLRALLLTVIPLSAEAANEGQIMINNAPVTITFCEFFKEDMVETPDGHLYVFGAVPYFQASSANSAVILMHLGAHFVDTDTCTADAVEIKFEMFDSFGLT
jgi:hypothetical protein